MPRVYSFLEDILDDCDISAADSLSEAWDIARFTSGLTDQELADKIATFFNMEADADPKVSDNVLPLIPESLARAFSILPLAISNERLRLAISDPTDQEAIRQAGFAAGRSVDAVIVAAPALTTLIDEKYNDSNELKSVVRQADKHADGKTLMVRGRTGVSALGPNTAPTERLFLLILKEAANHDVSDIHIQPFVGGAAVRFRIDGVMHQIKSMPLSVMQKLIRHVKAIADMDITNARTPQDGRLTMVQENTQRDLRVSILPVEQGERLVIRILSHEAKTPGSLNFVESQIALFRKSVSTSSGMILVTGPTGSGKTTTLYSMLGLLNHDTSNIMSVEDPVEVRLRGVSQSSVHPEQGLTFPAVLRSMLRQDPDVILVGEIRDSETAELAVRASLTGHLVLSTLHTIDAVTTIPRLVDLGLSPILLADALLCVVNQRLMRKLCDNCKIETTSTNASEHEKLYLQLTSRTSVYSAKGCAKCNRTGYSGRIPVSQIWSLTDDVRGMLRRNETDDTALFTRASQHGLKTLNESGRERITEGLTSVEEASRVLGSGFWAELGSEDHSALESIGNLDHRVSMKEKIIVVEPDTGLRIELVDELESRDYIVTAVDSAVEAARIIENGDPIDLMVLDVEHETRSPMDSFTDLRSALSWVGLSPLLLLPSGAQAVETALEIHGAVDYLVKPLPVKKICDQVEVILKRRHL